METVETGVVAARPKTARVDDDVASRFATCCRALGLTVYDRRRPADLAAARSGFTALVRIAHDQADAWVGLAAAGDTSLHVLEAISHNTATAGVLQRQVELPEGALGFRYDTGLYLKFRATEPDDFHLAYASALAGDGRFAAAHQLVSDVSRHRPSSREARWVTATIHYRAERWSDVVKLLSSLVNDPELDEHFAHAVKIALGISLARLVCLRQRCPTSRSRKARSPSRRSTAPWPERCRCVPTATRTPPARCCKTSMPPTRKTLRSKRR